MSVGLFIICAAIFNFCLRRYVVRSYQHLVFGNTVSDITATKDKCVLVMFNNTRRNNLGTEVNSGQFQLHE